MQIRVLVPKLVTYQELAQMFVQLANDMLAEETVIAAMPSQTTISTSVGKVLLQVEKGIMAPTTWNAHDVIGLMNDDAGKIGDEIPDRFFNLEHASLALDSLSERLQDASVRACNEVFERFDHFNLTIEALMSAEGIEGFEALLAERGEDFTAFVCGFGTCEAFLSYARSRPR